ncbi:HAD-IA family hydrolase [Salinisphaera sp.]|uniref:HAD family hydrolase n=1 Tax=Salinisphaera sp. TaxID=1914330 RepID=UPI000C42A5C5|nr:HAD-IA family hydrolase [Salinisphaera sp.]MBS62498.1 phosphoglycolate phosphatase [Salinisphaera sp.]
MKLQAFDAVLFDLDGTLLDTAPDLAGAINDMRAERGLDAMPLTELAPMCSFGGRGMLGKGLGLTPDDADYRASYDLFIETYRQRMTRDTQPFDGMREFVRQLADSGLAWGVVTNKMEALALPLMDHMNFDPPPGCVIGGDSAGVAKPDPAPMYLACERIGIEPARCVYIGDSDRDIEAGRVAGMATIGVSYGYIPPGDDIHGWQADVVIDTVAGLAAALEQLDAQAIAGAHPT